MEDADSPRDVITKLYRIAQNIPPSMLPSSALVTTIMAQLHRYLPIAHDRMRVSYSDKENDPTLWLECLMSLPNQGYNLGSLTRPSAPGRIRIPRHDQSHTTSVETPANILMPRTETTTNPIHQSRIGSCWVCNKPDHWAHDCPCRPPSNPRRFDSKNDHSSEKRFTPRLRHQQQQHCNRHIDNKYRRQQAYHIDKQPLPDDFSSNDDSSSSSDLEFEPLVPAQRDKYVRKFDKLTAIADKEHTTAESSRVNNTTFAVSVNDAKPERTGDGLHNLYEAFVKDECALDSKRSNGPIPVFFDSGSHPSWIKRRCIHSFGLEAFSSRKPARVSGVGKGFFLIDKNCTIYLGLKRHGSDKLVWIKTTAGVVPNDYGIPCNILLGCAVHEELGIRHDYAGKLIMCNVLDSPCLFPIPNSTIFRVSTPSEPSMLPRWREAFPHLFNTSLTRLDKSDNQVIRHVIDTADHSPVNIPARTYSPAQTKALDEFVERGIRKNIIRPSNSPWSSPALVVSKKTGGFRICVDFRRLNKCTRKNAFPLPNAWAQIERAAGHSYFTSLDLKDGFWQIAMSTDSIEKTAFSTHTGHWGFLVMPFGLCNSPATFETAMQTILRPCQAFVTRLLDDIMIFPNTESEHIDHFSTVLSILHHYGFAIQLRKCKWFTRSVVFLGFVISTEGIRPDPEKVSAVISRLRPSNITELRSFLTAAGYLRQFIKDFATIAFPLHELTKGSPRPGSKIKMTDNHFKANDRLKSAITFAPVLKAIHFGHPVVIATNASNHCLSAVLFQYHPFNGKQQLFPFAYASHKLTPTQQNYSAQEHELLGIVFSQTWRTWIEGTEITIHTDHQSLSGIRSQQDIPPRINLF